MLSYYHPIINIDRQINPQLKYINNFQNYFRINPFFDYLELVDQEMVSKGIQILLSLVSSKI